MKRLVDAHHTDRSDQEQNKQLKAELEQLRHDSDSTITEKETIIQKLTAKIL